MKFVRLTKLPLITLIVCFFAAIGACYYVTIYEGSVSVVLPDETLSPL
ncbi:MAG: hypothetical protein WC814_00720 [Candidatus Paceibacterota bacterium]|jgi:hypothetical protein